MISDDIIIIGGGIAGFSAATALAAAGARVCVVEARPTSGGRASSHRDPATGEIVDNGQHILMGCYRESFRFLRRIGTADLVRVQARLAVPMVDGAGVRSTLSCPPLPAPWHLLGGVLDWDALGWADRLSVFRIGPAIRTAQRHLRGKTTNLAASPDETVENWLIRNGQTARLRDLLWEPLALAAMNQPAHEAGATAFVRVLADAFGSNAGDSAIALPRVPLGQLWADPSRRFVEARGGTVITNALARVSLDGGRVTGIVTRGGERLRAGAVISTVPWHAVPTLFEHVPAPLLDLVNNARRMKSYPIVTVNLWFDRPVLDVPFVGLPGREMQWVFDKRAVFDGAATHLSLVSSGASRLVPMTNEQVVAIAMRELEAAIPEVTRARLRHAGVIRERNSTFSVAPGEPPRPACLTALPGFYLAGDWTDTALPGTIESAAMSGHTAARELEARG